MWQIWLIVSGLCFIIEMATVGFFVFWFGIGALLAMIVSFFTANIVVECSVFVISSVILLFLTKPLINRFTKKEKTIKMNSLSIIGKKGIVTQDINTALSIGLIKVSGETWSAKTLNDEILEKGTEIKVIQIDGVKAVVEPVKAEATNN